MFCESLFSSTQSNETSSFWALVELDGVEAVSMICYNRVDPSSAGTPTSSLLDGEWLCECGVVLAIRFVNVGTSTAEKHTSLATASMIELDRPNEP